MDYYTQAVFRLSSAGADAPLIQDFQGIVPLDASGRARYLRDRVTELQTAIDAAPKIKTATIEWKNMPLSRAQAKVRIASYRTALRAAERDLREGKS
jgi:hypothetical protein